ncbi:DUF6115 domain-containing protein [Paraliobacillus sediminis]|uniref:DUF6115 domain-containing protein n=1 Tax=Paraliobacillus sediminis TaxID=1885916 RepID=UPI001F086454|nr:hypothetical protein [Paraliobacillus sediminis]
MVYFLLLISFLLHVFTFIAIKILKDRITEPEDIAAKQAQQQKEMEELLAVYLLEIREENEKVVSMLTSEKNNKQVKNATHPPEVKNEQKDAYEKTDPIQQKETFKEPTVDYQPPKVNESHDTVEKSLSAQVLSLYNQGESIESIARKLDSGKTEIELMIKFHKKNS